MKYDAVGVLVAISRVPSKAMSAVPSAEALVPPLAIGRIPETSAVREARPEETTPPVVRRMPFASQFKLRLFEITWREEEDCPVTAKSVLVPCVVRKSLKMAEVAKKLVEVACVAVKRGKVLTAVVLVAVKYSPTTCPTTESFANGEVVPMPMLLLFVAVKIFVPAIASANTFPLPC